MMPKYIMSELHTTEVDLMFLFKAIENGDSKSELLLRVSDMRYRIVQTINRAEPPKEGVK
jgi:hypothetical protein